MNKSLSHDEGIIWKLVRILAELLDPMPSTKGEVEGE